MLVNLLLDLWPDSLYINDIIDYASVFITDSVEFQAGIGSQGPEKASAAEICSVFRSRCCVTWLNSKNNALVQMAAVADKEDAG